MAIALRILGSLSAACAGLIAYAAYEAHNSGAWFPGLFDNTASALIPVFVVLGLLGFIGAAGWDRENRETPVGLGLSTTPDRKDRAD
jgi:hypothetical protein